MVEINCCRESWAIIDRDTTEWGVLLIYAIVTLQSYLYMTLSIHWSSFGAAILDLSNVSIICVATVATKEASQLSILEGYIEPKKCVFQLLEVSHCVFAYNNIK